MDDGTQILTGVLEGERPDPFNPAYIWPFDAQGKRCGGDPITLDGMTDFEFGGALFPIDPDAGVPTHNLDIEEEAASPARASSEGQLVAHMTLPPGTTEEWNSLMTARVPAPADARVWEVLRMAYARFSDGTQAVAGIQKGDNPDFNPYFVWIFNAAGEAYSWGPIDTSDAESFDGDTWEFCSGEEAEDDKYRLVIRDAQG